MLGRKQSIENGVQLGTMANIENTDKSIVITATEQLPSTRAYLEVVGG